MCFKQIFKKVIFKIQPAEKEIFQIIRQTASELGFPTYIVGGYVRDRLLARPSKDVDIVCIGSGTALAQAVADKLSPKPKVAIFQRFGTAAFRHKSLEVEFVGARKESYRHDSRKPTVEEGTLEDDQNRRDFTINALAVSLNEADFGTILDSFGGGGWGPLVTSTLISKGRSPQYVIGSISVTEFFVTLASALTFPFGNKKFVTRTSCKGSLSPQSLGPG
ncbi:MAG: hypothetical protein RIS64_2737 [Bacteroidota bacterium]